MRPVFGQRFDDQFTARIGFGDPPVIGNFEQQRNRRLAAETLHAVVADADAVDDDAERQAQLTHRIDRQFEVMQAEWRRFGDQHDIVRTAQRRYRRAGGSGRRVENGGDAVFQPGFHRMDQSGSQRNADVEAAAVERDVSVNESPDGADPETFFADRVAAADQGTSAAAMAEFGEDERRAAE